MLRKVTPLTLSATAISIPKKKKKKSKYAEYSKPL